MQQQAQIQYYTGSPLTSDSPLEESDFISTSLTPLFFFVLPPTLFPATLFLLVGEVERDILLEESRSEDFDSDELNRLTFNLSGDFSGEYDNFLVCCLTAGAPDEEEYREIFLALSSPDEVSVGDMRRFFWVKVSVDFDIDIRFVCRRSGDGSGVGLSDALFVFSFSGDFSGDEGRVMSVFLVGEEGRIDVLKIKSKYLL
jgi:hypothetical protein